MDKLKIEDINVSSEYKKGNGANKKVTGKDTLFEDVATLGSFSPHTFDEVLYGEDESFVEDSDIEAIYQGYGKSVDVETLTSEIYWNMLWRSED